jgi:hypothetical protein
VIPSSPRAGQHDSGHHTSEKDGSAEVGGSPVNGSGPVRGGSTTVSGASRMVLHVRTRVRKAPQHRKEGGRGLASLLTEEGRPTVVLQ